MNVEEYARYTSEELVGTKPEQKESEYWAYKQKTQLIQCVKMQPFANTSLLQPYKVIICINADLIRSCNSSIENILITCTKE